MARPTEPPPYPPDTTATPLDRDAETPWTRPPVATPGVLDSAAFGERVLQLLDEGKRTSTYKYAVLLALTDLCLERYAEGAEALTTRELAERVIELYWPQSTPYGGMRETAILAQNQGGQAEILSAIRRFRDGFSADPSESLSRVRLRDPARYESLLATVEWKLIEMPLPRLQLIGDRKAEFLYRIGWDENVKREDTRDPSFDARLHLQPGVGENLVRLSGLLRPLIQRSWASMVARIKANRSVTDEARLQEFLFGAHRIALDPVRTDLSELQSGRCFYCEGRLSATFDVDHFIPWARHADNGIENLVAADARCNNSKRDFLAAGGHVERWVARFADASRASQLSDIASRRRWDRHPMRTLGVARAIYARLPDDVRLWRLQQQFSTVAEDRAGLARTLHGARIDRGS